MKPRPRFTFVEALVIFGVVALLVSILLPSLNRMRETSGRLPCPSNLKQIGQAILLYANQNAGAMPDSFATILRTQDLTPKVLICPSDDARAAADVASFRGDERDCSYVYVGDGVPNAAIGNSDIVAFDRPDTHAPDGINALFGDGHVEYLDFAAPPMPRDWWKDVERQIARGDRPVRMPAAATQPGR